MENRATFGLHAWLNSDGRLYRPRPEIGLYRCAWHSCSGQVSILSELYLYHYTIHTIHTITRKNPKQTEGGGGGRG